MFLAIDVDEVLADLNPQFIAFLNRAYNLSLTAQDWVSPHTEVVLNCSREEAIEKIHAFYVSPEFKSIHPVTGAVEAVTTLHAEHRLIAITARNEELTEVTLAFLGEYYPGIFSEVFFTNHLRIGGPTTTKADLCAEMKVDLLIDDNLHYAHECAEQNIRVLLLDALWNQEENLPEQVRRVYSWSEILEIMNDSSSLSLPTQ